MNRILFQWMFLPLLIVALFFSLSSCDNGGGGDGGSSSGTITVEFSSPGLEPGDSGYIEYTGTLTVEDGNMTTYELTGRRYIGLELVIRAERLPDYYAMRYKITRTVSRDADGLYAGIAEATRELQTFYLDNADDPIPSFDPESRNYEKGRGEFEWDGNRLISFTGYSMEEEAWVAGNKNVYEYYANGKLKSIREGDWSHETLYFEEAEYYKDYDAVFENFPALTKEFYAEYGDYVSIPDDYDYDSNQNLYETEDKTRYSYTADTNGRIGTVIQEEYEIESWENELKIEVSYDTSGNVSTVKLYFHNDGWPEDPTMQMDFSIPSGLSLSFEGLFFPPWNEVLVPFFEDSGVN